MPATNPTAFFLSADWSKDRPRHRDPSMDILNRITFDPKQCGGRPCVRGLRIRVTDVLDLLDAGLSREAVLAEMPDLEADDISACIRFARRRVDHSLLAG